MGEIAEYYASQALDEQLNEDLKEEARRKAAEFWKCKDGRRLRPREMTTEHLRNAIAFTERRYSEMCAKYYPQSPDGLEWVPRTPKIEEWCPAYESLRTELQSRK